MEVTTITLFRFDKLVHKAWAFSQMGLAPRRLSGTHGASFFKLLGSGGGNGFSVRPNFSVYGMLAVWPHEMAAWSFFSEHPVYQSYVNRCVDVQTFFLSNTMAHGQWDGQMPFHATANFDLEQPTAVLTRATIYPFKMWQFWREVPVVSKMVAHQPGVQLAVGIGELPWVQQATFSIWKTGLAMRDYAYRQPEHKKVIEQTRALNWYKEELFARFAVYRTIGSGFAELPNL